MFNTKKRLEAMEMRIDGLEVANNNLISKLKDTEERFIKISEISEQQFERINNLKESLIELTKSFETEIKKDSKKTTKSTVSKATLDKIEDAVKRIAILEDDVKHIIENRGK